MVNEKLNKFLVGFALLFICFTLDRVSKIYILNILNNTGVVDIYINKFINFYLVWNTGVGFGLFSSENENIYLSFTILIICINFFIIYMAYVETKIKSYYLMIILGGSLGNLFDRIYYKSVPDFIDINFNGYHWFIFNVSDILITIGIICLIFTEIINYKTIKDKNEK